MSDQATTLLATADSSHSKPKTPVVRGAKACSVCRASKMRCIGGEPNERPCNRCKKLGQECVFEKHKRGRKPGSKLSEASKLARRQEKAAQAAAKSSQPPSSTSVPSESKPASKPAPKSANESSVPPPSRPQRPSLSSSSSSQPPSIPPPSSSEPHQQQQQPYNPPPPMTATTPWPPSSHPHQPYLLSTPASSTSVFSSHTHSLKRRSRSPHSEYINTEQQVQRYAPGNGPHPHPTILDPTPFATSNGGVAQDPRPNNHASSSNFHLRSAAQNPHVKEEEEEEAEGESENDELLDPQDDQHRHKDEIDPDDDDDDEDAGSAGSGSDGKPRLNFSFFPSVILAEEGKRVRESSFFNTVLRPSNNPNAQPRPHTSSSISSNSATLGLRAPLNRDLSSESSSSSSSTLHGNPRELAPLQISDGNHARATMPWLGGADFRPGPRTLGANSWKQSIKHMDPIERGLVTLEEAEDLFDRFYEYLNRFICLFDKRLHTVAYVRSSCPFLFTCLIMAGCKFWKREQYKAVRDLAHQLAVRAFAEGWKSVEVVQAFACLTYWKEPGDTNTWTYIGFACRMALEIGLNRVSRHHSHMCSAHPQYDETMLDYLKRRDRERTYLILFVHDRSLAMQTGRSWMLPESDELVKNAETWFDRVPSGEVPCAVCARGGVGVDEEGGDAMTGVVSVHTRVERTVRPEDTILSAQVHLRRIAAETIEVFMVHRGQPGMLYSDINYELLLQHCNSKLGQWRTKWLSEIPKAGGDPLHVALMTFFHLHVRLFLNSFGLQSSIQTGSREVPRLAALSTCYTSALESLDIVTQTFASKDRLQYVQDSANVMTAYSAIVLLRLLRNPATLADLDSSAAQRIYDQIEETALVYEQSKESADPTSGAASHARFLRSLVQKDRYDKKRAADKAAKHRDGRDGGESTSGSSAYHNSPTLLPSPSNIIPAYHPPSGLVPANTPYAQHHAITMPPATVDSPPVQPSSAGETLPGSHGGVVQQRPPPVHSHSSAGYDTSNSEGPAAYGQMQVTQMTYHQPMNSAPTTTTTTTTTANYIQYQAQLSPEDPPPTPFSAYGSHPHPQSRGQQQQHPGGGVPYYNADHHPQAPHMVHQRSEPLLSQSQQVIHEYGGQSQAYPPPPASAPVEGGYRQPQQLQAYQIQSAEQQHQQQQQWRAEYQNHPNVSPETAYHASLAAAGMPGGTYEVDSEYWNAMFAGFGYQPPNGNANGGPMDQSVGQI